MGFNIEDSLVQEAGGSYKIYRKNQIIAEEGKIYDKYLYLVEGELSVFNFTEDGKEFLQHKVFPGNFFGDPAVLTCSEFPGNVRVISDKANICVLPKKSFEPYLMVNPELLLDFAKAIAEKNIIKSDALKHIVFNCPEQRIINQLNVYKKQKSKDNQKILIDLTRKEISNMTGLRIETVIRTIKKMETDGKLELKNSKIYY